MKTKTTKSSTITRKSMGKIKEVHVKAHEIYCNRIKNNIPGDSKSDWFQAEQELN